MSLSAKSFSAALLSLGFKGNEEAIGEEFVISLFLLSPLVLIFRIVHHTEMISGNSLRPQDMGVM